MAGNLGNYVCPSRAGVANPVLNSGSVLSGALADNIVYSGNIASGQVGAFHLSSGSVVSGRIASGSLFTLQVASGGFLSGAIGSGVVGWNHLTPNIKATQGETSSGISNSGLTTPFTVGYHRGVAKAWLNMTLSGNSLIRNSFNVSSVTDVGIGVFTVNWISGLFSSPNYVCTSLVSNLGTSGTAGAMTSIAEGTAVVATESITFNCFTLAGTLMDTGQVQVSAFGDRP